jgi:hypothetical protein
MSKVSNKARLQQLKEWMDSRGQKMTGSANAPRKRFSKSDHYNKTR